MISKTFLAQVAIIYLLLGKPLLTNMIITTMKIKLIVRSASFNIVLYDDCLAACAVL